MLLQGSTSGREEPSEYKECYVKWKGKSYMHCSWVPLQEIQSAANFTAMPSASRSKLRKLLSDEDAKSKTVRLDVYISLLLYLTKISASCLSRKPPFAGNLVSFLKH